MADVVYLRSYDDRSRSDDESARRVLDATVELLREVPYSSITMRSIAKRAGVAHGEVRAHFRSKDAIVAEIYLERLRAAPLIVDVEQSARSGSRPSSHSWSCCWRTSRVSRRRARAR